MNASIEMPRYICHKTVHALQIGEVRQSPAAAPVEGGSWELVPSDTRYSPLTVTHDWYTKHSPVAGGYFVVYKDGFESFSPAEAFESGYTSEEEARASGDKAPVEPSAISTDLPARFGIDSPVLYRGTPHHVVGITFGNDGEPWVTPIRYHLTRDRDNGAGRVISNVESDQVSAIEEPATA